MGFSAARDIVEPARCGSPAAIEELIEAVWPDAVRLATAIAGDRLGGEDAAQEACIALYRRIGTLRSVEALSFWFYRIVVREVWQAGGETVIVLRSNALPTELASIKRSMLAQAR